MKFTIVILVAILAFAKVSAQKDYCNYWYVEPVLYNNYINDSALVEYWENYWYYRSGDDPKLMPDSLKIVLNLIPSTDLLVGENSIKGSITKYRLRSTLVFKYGMFDDSHILISPQVSEPIILFDNCIDLKEELQKFIATDQMGFSLYPESIMLKKILDDLNISIEDGNWDFEQREKPFALNQIIITSSFINDQNEIIHDSEFTFPINGSYGNPNAGKWEF